MVIGSVGFGSSLQILKTDPLLKLGMPNSWIIRKAKSCHSWISDAGVRKAGNHPEQSGAQNGLKLAMAQIYDQLLRDFKGWVYPVLQIHDELIHDCHPDVSEQFAFECGEIMKDAVPLDVPVESSSDIAERWGDLKWEN